MRLPVILAAGTALSTLVASTCGCGCFYGRPYAATDWRELRRVEASFAKAAVDEEGFYPPAVCEQVCRTSGQETRGRCYPVEVTVPVPPERVAVCNYIDGWPAEERRPMPRADAAAARLDKFGHLDEATCERSCAVPDRRLNYCRLEPDVPPPPPPGEAFVVCTLHRPAGCDVIIR